MAVYSGQVSENKKYIFEVTVISFTFIHFKSFMYLSWLIFLPTPVLLPLTSALRTTPTVSSVRPKTRSPSPMSVLWPLFWVLGLLTPKMEAVRYSETLIFVSIIYVYSVYAVHIVLFDPTSCVWHCKQTYGLV